MEKAEGEIIDKPAEKPKHAGGRPKEVFRDEEGMRILIPKKKSTGKMVVQEGVNLNGIVTDVFTHDGRSFWRDELGHVRALPTYDTPEQLVTAIEAWEQRVLEKVNAGEDIIPDAEALAVGLGISLGTLKGWQSGNRGEAFSKIVGVELNKIAAVKNQLAMKGAIPPLVWTVMMNNNHGYVQNQKIDIDVTAHREPLKEDELVAQAKLLP